ncbi:MAG: biotin--[acetyl-CoA-carboxylase] ligase [Candidatus Accumulibacter phosphatis]|jgi:BirA family biotin operon repressor/biotin-[acetyl-CoA-carboxylase] ligase|uniref:Biotin--[acetyl-CoA-carboxylase] ligase n=1 Tax=Candidatus Accumulibacter contiguus TaxID=2954381 RepID=A0ABX1TBB1_9PROT|nr:biotin--[acetyl-CoA-carboxylase] ligase [Candidatus Accumulibacter contiguus]NMQ06952.1 biotin--[acetyl-CoA-carboxylase] ligase [Candidatus Accumulibacter contiguus]
MDHACRPCQIDAARLSLLLGPAQCRFTVETLRECSSTSTLLLERARQGAPSGALLVADQQTAGRGRRGRSWLSSPEAGLTFSLLWHIPGDMARLAGLSLAVGVAVARSLEACGVAGVGLKWPNDILLDGGKVGGILIELEATPGGMLAVIGIGLNLQMPAVGAEELQEFLHRPAALAQRLSPVPERHQLLAQLLLDLAAVLDDFSATGFPALRSEWQARHVWQDRQVRLLNGGLLDREGICLGADADGALLLLTANGVERCLSGDLSLQVA